jgi:integrase
VVEQSAREIGIERFGAHDLRRTCAKLCRKNGGDLERIKFLLVPARALLHPDDGAVSWVGAGDRYSTE